MSAWEDDAPEFADQIALPAPSEPQPATPPAEETAQKCEACRGTEVVPVWDSARRQDWHQQTCPVCQPYAAVPFISATPPAAAGERLEALARETADRLERDVWADAAMGPVWTSRATEYARAVIRASYDRALDAAREEEQ